MKTEDYKLLHEALENYVDSARDTLSEVIENPMTKIRPMRRMIAERDMEVANAALACLERIYGE